MARSPHGGHRLFLDGAVSSKTDDCIMWPYATDQDGYGICKVERRTKRVHRAVCETVHGAPPAKDYQAAHSCGCRTCANPRHIRWATPKENTHDKFLHGSMQKGEQIAQSKLDEDQVRQIKSRLGRQSGASLASSFGVSESTISHIKNGKWWRHVE